MRSDQKVLTVINTSDKIELHRDVTAVSVC